MLTHHLNRSPKRFQIIFLFSLLLLINSTAKAQISNDECDNAMGIPVGTSCSYITYTNVGATYSSNTPLPACASYTTAAADVWFKVIVPAGGTLMFDTEAGVITNGGMAIYSGSCNALTLIECDDNDGNGSMPMIYRSGLTPGTSIFIRFWEYGGGTYGTFGLCVYSIPPPPPCASNPVAGDYCSTAVPICNLNGYCGNTSATYTATVSPTDPTDEDSAPLGSVFCGSIENNSWLSFVADATTSVLNVYVSNCSTAYGIQMEVYTTTDCYNFTSVSNCWNPASVVSGTITATGLTPGQTYYLMIDGNAGCVCDYIISAASGVFTLDAGPDATICEGQSTTLNASGATSYTWSPSTGLSDSTSANPVASPTVTTTYTLTGTGGNPSCPGTITDIVTVTVNPIPTSDFTVSDPNCDDNMATITYTGTASSSANYDWGFSAGSPYPGYGPGPQYVQWLNPGSYDITLTVTENNCVSTQTTHPVLVSDIGFDPSTQTDVICYGESNGTATVYPINGSAPYSYQWSTIPQQTTQTATGLAAGIYFATITDDLGCTTYDSVIILQPTQLDISLSSENEGCQNSCDGSVNIIVTGGIPPYQYNWTGSSLHTAEITGLCAGDYSVTVTDMNSCTITEAATLITEYPIDANFIVSPNDSILLTNTFTFTFTGTGAVDYFWDFGDGTTSNVPNPDHVFLSEGEYHVILTVYAGGPDSCVETMDMNVYVFLPADVTIPNIFTPNGDNINDVFKVKSTGLQTEEMIIYNRWGKKIFSWNEPGGEWDGANAADGVYYYVLVATGKFDGKEIRRNGTVSLIR